MKKVTVTLIAGSMIIGCVALVGATQRRGQLLERLLDSGPGGPLARIARLLDIDDAQREAIALVTADERAAAKPLLAELAANRRAWLEGSTEGFDEGAARAFAACSRPHSMVLGRSVCRISV